LPRKTESSNPADWLFFVGEDLGLIGLSIERELYFLPSQAKLAEALEKILKAELIRWGWPLERIHDLRRLASALRQFDPELVASIDSVCEDLADAYFSDRYPGFDLEDPDWPTLRAQFAAVTALAAEIRRRLVSPPL